MGDVVIHAPDEFISAGKTLDGRAIAKPVSREDVKFSSLWAVIIGGGVLFSFLAAFTLGRIFVESPTVLNWAVIGLSGLVAVPLAMLSYWVLTDPELEQHTGWSLWIRSAICGTIYAGLWVAWTILKSFGYGEELVSSLVLLVPVVGIGTAAPLACFDLELENSAAHFAAFMGVSLLLRGAAWLPWI